MAEAEERSPWARGAERGRRGRGVGAEGGGAAPRGRPAAEREPLLCPPSHTRARGGGGGGGQAESRLRTRGGFPLSGLLLHRRRLPFLSHLPDPITLRWRSLRPSDGDGGGGGGRGF